MAWLDKLFRCRSSQNIISETQNPSSPQNTDKASSRNAQPNSSTIGDALSELFSSSEADMRRVMKRHQKVLLTKNVISTVVTFALIKRYEDPQQACSTLLLAELLDRARTHGINAAFRRPPVERQIFETQNRWIFLGGDVSAQRHFLEEHPELLSYSSLAQLQRTITMAQQVAQEPMDLEQWSGLNRLWLLLFEARQRGGDVQAIRDAYVNWHGGFALDIPDWLTALVERDNALKRSGHRAQAARLRIVLWEEALKHAQREPSDLAPEVEAEIYVKAQEAYKDAHGLDKAELQQREHASIVSSLTIYTRQRYPYPWAYRQGRMGALYLTYLHGNRAEYIEKAIHCLQSSLDFFNARDFPLEWAQTHNYLGWAYRDRLQGNREENIEQGLLSFQAALRVLNEYNATIDWAMVQSNLGTLYMERLQGHKSQNIRTAITCLQAALRVFKQEVSPLEWASTQMELGNALFISQEEHSEDRLQQSLACFQKALQVYTEEEFPLEWATTQTNLGNAYTIHKEHSLRHQELAIAHYQASMRIFTRHQFPVEWARSQINLGTVYDRYQQGNIQENREKAIACFRAALTVYTRQTFPELHRSASLNLSSCSARNGQWEVAHTAAADAQKAEEDLLALAAGVKEMDTILYQGGLGILWNAFSLVRLGHYVEAIEAVERGRTRTLASARLLNTADPQQITHPQLREAYLSQRTALKQAQIALQQGSTRRLPREEWVARITNVRLARTAFDTTVAAIRAAAAPADFLHDDFSAKTIVRIIAEKPAGYALVYLLATPLGGLALGLFNSPAETPPRCAVLDLPTLMLDILHSKEVEDSTSYLWHIIRNQPPINILQQKLQWLSDAALQPLATWLQQEGISHLTLIPCGLLAAFPLLSVSLKGSGHERVTLADCLIASVAPTARILLDDHHTQQRSGIATLGNPYPTHQPLRWGEAEALTLASLGGDPSRAAIQYEANRTHLLDMLDSAQVVAISSHGIAEADYLQSRIFLANGEKLTLADALNNTITNMHGLQLLILSACQTAVLSLQGAPDEVRSLAMGMLQAGAKAVIASLWPVDDRATYLLMVRFAQEWFPSMESMPAAAALARAQRWLRTVTNRELQSWEAKTPLPPHIQKLSNSTPAISLTREPYFTPSRGIFPPTQGTDNDLRSNKRYSVEDAEQIMQELAVKWEQRDDPHTCPYADPFYWAGFQLYGW